MEVIFKLHFTDYEKEILIEMSQKKRYPIVRLELHNSENQDIISIALNYVRITDPEDTMDVVKSRGEALKSLMEKGLVFIDYTTRVWVAGDYDIYYKSKIYELLCHTVMDAAKNPGAVFNQPYMRKGYAKLTVNGTIASLNL